MELTEALKSRKSIRGYLPEPVPREILKQVLEKAIMAPSNDNSQPWSFIVLGGKPLDDLRKSTEEYFLKGTEFHPDFPIPRSVGFYRERQIELAKSLFQLMNIAREDKEKRQQWLRKMVRMFDAPNAIIITLDDMGEPANVFYFLFSIGMLTQNIALAALEYGLGTCVNLMPILYPDAIKPLLEIPQNQKLASLISIGYPDPDYPANRVRTSRESLDKIATWQGV